MELSSVSLRSPGGNLRAEFVPEANMLCRSLSLAGAELLDGGHGLEAYVAQGKTMGIPLLYPWANRLGRRGYQAAGKRVELPEGDSRIPVDPNGLPIHGVMPGLLRWAVEAQSDPSALSAVLHWRDPGLLELFPFEHEVLFEATLRDRSLTIVTTVHATGSDPVPVSFGFHPYVKLPDSSRRSWRVKLAAFRTLELDDRMIPTGQRRPVERRQFELGEQSLDHGYDALAIPPEFEVASSDQALTVEFLQGYPFAQVYAPPAHDYICFEPMTAPTDALNSGDGLQVLAPGEQHCAAFAVRLHAPGR
jgi:aldose 1-epimerase